MTTLSPQAQAVLDAATHALNNLDACGFNHQRYDRKALAAALLAAADQVVPGNGSRRANEIRSEFLAIVTELKNHQ